MTTPSIRMASAEDAAVIAGFNAAMALETEGKRLDADTVLRGVRSVFESDQRGFYLLAERDGRVVGQAMVTFEWSDWRSGNFWWFQSVYVIPEMRRAGVFRALYESVLKRARGAANVCGLRLYVETHNLAAQRAYEALGMREANYKMYELDFVFGTG